MASPCLAWEPVGPQMPPRLGAAPAVRQPGPAWQEPQPWPWGPRPRGPYFFAALFFAAERFFVRPGAAIFAVFLVFDLAILAMIVLPIVSAQAFSTVYPFRPTMALPSCSP